jgi:hypothetical protein
MNPPVPSAPVPLTLNAVRKDQSGLASALLSTSQLMGGPLGLSVAFRAGALGAGVAFLVAVSVFWSTPPKCYRGPQALPVAAEVVRQ